MTSLIPSELPQSLRVDAVPSGGCDVVITADPVALDALALRMGIPAVLQFTCQFALGRGPTGTRTVLAEGHLHARVVLSCVITTESFECVLDEPFALRFVPLSELDEQPDPEAIDEVPYEDGVLALGEAAAEQLALSLPAFPRRPGAETSDESAFLAGDETQNRITNDGMEDEPPALPFAALAPRRQPM
jgi:uncharacterized metal-binding protein YceD (DUF177 family)